MVGITGFDFTLIKSKFIVNLDSEVENHLFVGSAGYIYSSIKFQKKQTVVIAKEGDVIMDILLCGMMGGHSGLDIHKGCTNAIIAMAAIMQALNNLPINLVNLKGGDKVNQIPNEAKVSILLPGILVDEVTALLKNNTAKIAEMYFDDIVLHQDISSVDMDASVSIIENAQELFLLLLSLPNGVLGMEPLRADLVRTSCNLGVIKADYEAFCVEALLRSSSMGDMEVYQSRINALAGHFGASVKVVNQSISWQPKFDTQLLKTCRAVALNVFGVEPEIVSIHAGLECAAFDVALPSAQKISFGPLIKGAHTIRECVDLQSVERFWQFLTKLLLAVKY